MTINLYSSRFCLIFLMYVVNCMKISQTKLNFVRIIILARKALKHLLPYGYFIKFLFIFIYFNVFVCLFCVFCFENMWQMIWQRS